MSSELSTQRPLRKFKSHLNLVGSCKKRMIGIRVPVKTFNLMISLSAASANKLISCNWRA